MPGWDPTSSKQYTMYTRPIGCRYPDVVLVSGDRHKFPPSDNSSQPYDSLGICRVPEASNRYVSMGIGNNGVEGEKGQWVHGPKVVCYEGI